MSAARRALALVRKEFQLVTRFRFSFLTQFFISPAISVLTAGLLYSGFFRTNATTSLGDVHAGNYKPFLLVGLLTHACLSVSYYGLSTKILKERFSRTLALLWMAPGSRVVTLLGLAGPEAVRCAVLAALGFAAVATVASLSFTGILVSLLCLVLIFSLGLAYGLIRGALTVVYEGAADVVDQFYFVFIFTGCLYIPRTLLPRILWPVCEANPLYHATLIMKGALAGEPVQAHVAGFAAGLVAMLGVAALLWTKGRARVLEETPT